MHDGDDHGDMHDGMGKMGRMDGKMTWEDVEA